MPSLSREWALYLTDLVEACEKITRFTHQVSRTQFETEDMVRDAVLRNLMVIGEATKRIPKNKSWSSTRLNGAKSQDFAILLLMPILASMQKYSGILSM